MRIPSSVEEAVSLITGGWIPLAGGTDIVPRISWNLLPSANLMAIGSLPGLRGIRKNGDMLTIGAMTPLNVIAEHPVTPHWLKNAVEQTATRVIRHQATLGGNLLQGRRCRYYNRPAHWRAVAGNCRRTGGSTCFAGHAGPGCVAALRSSISAVLIASDTTVTIRTPYEEEIIDLYSLYSRSPLVGDLHPKGLITAVHIPLGNYAETIEYSTLTRRTSLDFPEIAVAVNHRHTHRTGAQTIIVMTAPLSRPSRYVLSDPSHDRLDDITEWINSSIPHATTGLYGPEYLRNAARTMVFRILDPSQ